jgi:hypothetical protein
VRRFVLDVDMIPLNSGVSAAHGVSTVHVLDARPDALVVRFDAAAILAGADWDELDAMAGDPVVVPEESALYQSVVIALASSAIPTLEWIAP